ncbi:hypothetical protein HDU99_005254, partial [Rhizoclosmatium hyalinum]
MYPASLEFAHRRLSELLAISQESTHLAAVFQTPVQSSDTDHYSIDISLEIKWLGLVVKALSGYQPLSPGSISPYDLDEEGDGAPLGPIGVSESVRGSLFPHGNSVFDARDVVIKRVRTPKKRDTRQQFYESSLSWLQTSATNKSLKILPLLGVCYETIPPLLVTPYLKNGNILQYSKLYPGHSLRLLTETASTMSALHSLGILHGALRSSNVLVDDAGKAVVADFGLWEYRRDVGIDGLARNGWRRWTAPEVLRGGNLKPHSDVYSFAMTMYEILSGNMPFHNTLNDPDDPNSGFDPDTEESDIARLVLFDSIRPTRPSHCPDKFWALIESCWIQDPLQRPSFSSIEGQLQTLLKMQAQFRRQSQIKSRAEAFLVEVPLDDLMSSVMAVGSPKSSVRNSLNVAIPSAVPDRVYEKDLDSAKSSSRISVNLSFNLDSNVLLSTIRPLPLGIDLPPESDESDTDSDGENLPIDTIEEWSSEYDESIFAFWDVLTSTIKTD